MDIWKDRGLLERQTTLGKTNDILERQNDNLKNSNSCLMKSTTKENSLEWVGAPCIEKN